MLDGLTGTGKTMFTPLLSSYNRMQNARFEYMFEYISISAKMNKVESDATSSLLNLLADVKYYDGMLSREVNFRPSDLSSIFKSSKTFHYLKQLFMSDGKSIDKRLETEKQILLLATHQLIGCLDILLNAFNNRLKVIEMVRHPLYLLDHWESYIMMHGYNARDFTLWIEKDGYSLPWFSNGFEDLYVKSKSYDRAVLSIKSLMNDVFDVANRVNIKENVIFIPFEKFVLEPEDYLKKIESFIGTTSTRFTKKILKKQRVPRPSINAGPQKKIYKRYGLSSYDKNITHKEDYELKIESAQTNCSKSAFDEIMNLSDQYEKYFGRWF
ncbi:sulfotransferase [Candidatus Marinimicrobia bacterium]|nr:sulfotransferase [Candidatus Neomarinimicrobiota bacterium]